MTDLNQEHHAERLERSLRVWLAEGRPARADREASIDAVLGSLDDTPRTRARFPGRWIQRGGGARRGADAHEHPPNTNRRNRLMYSATGLTAAFAIAALAANHLAVTLNQPAAIANDTHVVAADGTGDFDTIGEAVSSVSDGDTVLVRPGTYVEAFAVYHDITLAGDGPVGEIVIMAPPDAPVVSLGRFSFSGHPESYAVLVRDSDASLSNLTFRGAETSIVVEGGSPILSNLVFDGAGVPWSEVLDEGGQYAVVIQDGSRATFVDNIVAGGAGIAVADMSTPAIERNVLTAGATIAGSAGDGTVIRDNTIADAPSYAIYLSDPATVTLERNVIEGAGDSGIQAASMGGHVPTIRDNRVSGVRYGIQLSGGMPYGTAVEASGASLISGNDVSAELVGISLGESSSVVTDNTVRDSLNGIVTGRGGSAQIRGNNVDVTGYGIDVGAYSSPTVDGNTICGATESIIVRDTATPSIGENDTC